MITKLVICFALAMITIFIISLNDYRKAKKVGLIKSLEAHIKGIIFWVNYEIKKFKDKSSDISNT
jgi:hypothetical protein